VSRNLNATGFVDRVGLVLERLVVDQTLKLARELEKPGLVSSLGLLGSLGDSRGVVRPVLGGLGRDTGSRLGLLHTGFVGLRDVYSSRGGSTRHRSRPRSHFEIRRESSSNFAPKLDTI
jgi:hypothetical protein